MFTFILLLLVMPIHSIEIKDVSAMCSSEGITAAIDFSDKFDGKIYSMDYATVHECIYYNSLQMDTVLFSIPVHRCGTKLTRTTRGIVDQMENRVYVQMDKDMQSVNDKQFNFVCRLEEGRKSTIRRHPVRDTYAMAPNLKDSMEPIKPKEIHMAAVSNDKAFGNWPIPGSKPYDPSMKPLPVFPPPIAAILITHSTEAPLPITIPMLSEPIKARAEDTYPSMPLPTTRPPPPPVQAVVFHSPPVVQQPPNSYPKPPMNNYVQPFHTPPVAMRPPPLPHVNPYVIPSNSQSDSYKLPPGAPINPDIHMKQAIGMGLREPQAPATLIPAKTWNQATTSEPSSHIQYKEEPKRIGVEFTKDVDENTINVHEDESFKEHLTSTQEHYAPKANVQLEIQQGEGPLSTPVSHPVKIGENITLVVKAQSQMKEEDGFDMFVHTCFATDGPGTTKIDLIDANGCSLRKEFVGPLKRLRKGSQMMYYFRISAFKFPGPDDVYFSCSIELSPLRKSQDICVANARQRREVEPKKQLEMRMFDIVRVELPEKYEKERVYDADSSLFCATSLFFYTSTFMFFSLLIAFFVSSLVALHLHFRLRHLQRKY